MAKKAKNESLTKAKIAKSDEFYTNIQDVEDELKYYKDHFKDKVVFCNCDDPEQSNFWKYFKLKFDFLGLKKLISTHYHETERTYKLELEKKNGELVTTKTDLMQNGDFRSPECVELLKEADIVVSNPPFSLMIFFLNLLVEHDKKFLFISNQNALTYKDVFPLVRENKLWLGVNSGPMEFEVPNTEEYKRDTGWREDAETGKAYRTLGNICWFTNLEHNKRNEELILWETYTPEKFPKYDNYDAINVGKVSEIPLNYTEIKTVTVEELNEVEASGFVFDEIDRDGDNITIEIKNPVMGVPITFLNKYCPNQFEIVAFRKGDDGQDLVFTREREREFNHTFVSLCDVDSRNDKELRRRNQWESYLRKNNDKEENIEPIDYFFPNATNLQNTLVNDCTINGEKTYVRVLIRRKIKEESDEN